MGKGEDLGSVGCWEIGGHNRRRYGSQVILVWSMAILI